MRQVKVVYIFVSPEIALSAKSVFLEEVTSVWVCRLLKNVSLSLC